MSSRSLSHANIRDADLLEELERNRSNPVLEVVVRQLEQKQAKRDELTTMPRDKRRRATTRHEIAEKAPAARRTSFGTSTACSRSADCRIDDSPWKSASSSAVRAR